MLFNLLLRLLLLLTLAVVNRDGMLLDLPGVPVQILSSWKGSIALDGSIDLNGLTDLFRRGLFARFLLILSHGWHLSAEPVVIIVLLRLDAVWNESR